MAGARFAWGLAALAAVAAGPLSCREPTQISVVVRTDVKCADAKGTTLTVGNLADLDQPVATTETTACSEGRIGELVVVPSGDNDGTVAVRVVLGFGRKPSECVAPSFGAGCIVARRALRYIPHTPLKLPIFMAASCAGILCSATETCVAGKCRDATIDDPSACASEQGCDESALGPGGSTPQETPVGDGGTAPSGGGGQDAGAPCSPSCDAVAASTGSFAFAVAVTPTALYWSETAGAPSPTGPIVLPTGPFSIMTSALDGSGRRALASGEQAPPGGLEAFADTNGADTVY